MSSRTATLTSRMTEREAPQSDSKAALEALVFECLERTETEGDAALESLCAAHPALAPKLRERLAVLRRAGLVGAAPSEPFPETLGEFRLLERLGAGGMGVVYLAEQTSLARRVALKLIRPENLYFPGARERFRREVEAVARLQHRSIASVYTVGDERGIPYFAMEYVDGLSLAEIVARLHEREPAELFGLDLARLFDERQPSGSESDERATWFDGTWANVVSRLVLEIASAVDHAHQRGVLHRDIKPSNVMLTASGRVALLDFGLASHTGAEKLTRTGAQLGSLLYMAPEQVNGEAAAIDAKTDVYAMGVLMYELLVLRAAYFDPTSSERTRRLVLGGNAPSLRSRYRGLSRDVETVCLAAMTSERTGRYASAAAFARDLENVIARRPIEARRSSAFVKVWKWTQRHPAAAAALILAVAAPLGIALQQNTANRRLFAANTTVSNLNRELEGALSASRSESQAKEEQRALAVLNLASAVDAVDTMLERVGSDRLRFTPQMESVRRELLEDAVRFYRELAVRTGPDDRLLDKILAARTKLGDVLLRLGFALEADRELSSVVDELAALPTLGQNGRHQAAIAQGFLAEARRVRSEHDQALELARDSVKRLEELMGEPVVDASRVGALKSNLAIALSRQGEFEFAAGNAANGERCTEKALSLMRVSLAEADNPRMAYTCAKSLGFLASVRSEREEFEPAIAAAEESIAILEKLHAAEPDDTGITQQLFSGLGNLGDIYGEIGQPERSRPLVERALGLAEALASQFPNTPRFRQNLAIVCVQAFFVEMGEQHVDAGRKFLERALELQRRLVADEPTNSEYIAAMCTTIGNLGALAMQADDVALALALFEEADVAILRALDSNPKNPEWIRWHVVGVRNRAGVLMDLGRYEAARIAIAELDRYDSTSSAVLSAQLSTRAAGVARDGAHKAPDEVAGFVERALAALDLAIQRGLDDPRAFEPADRWGPHLEAPAFLERIALVRAKAAAKSR